MFIRSSTATNDCLIALDVVGKIYKSRTCSTGSGFEIKEGFFICVCMKKDCEIIKHWEYETQEARDKAYDELCAFLNTNYKLRDFT